MIIDYVKVDNINVCWLTNGSMLYSINKYRIFPTKPCFLGDFKEI